MLFETERLRVRMLREGDAPVVAAYRADPAINALQDWDLPYTLERAQERLAAQAALDGPTPGEWVNLAMEVDGANGTEVIGDLACHLHSHGRIAEIGYTLRTEFHGKGYASEGAGALVDHLLATTEVHRLEASLDKTNIASMRVLEAVGFTFEVITRLSYPMRGGFEDDMRYSMLREDRAAWLARPSTPPAAVELVEITPDDAYLWGRLRTHHSQERFVAPMWQSFRDALFPEVVDGAPVVPWLRGVLADGERVGFVMMADVTEHHPDPYLWRLLIDRMHQRRGLGSRIMPLVQRRAEEQGCRTLLTSYVEGPGTPRPFYERLGFVPTGNIVGEDVPEVEARLTW